MKILITKEGSVVAMYNDRLLPIAARLGGANTMSVERASNVEWEDGEWVARDVNTNEKLGAGKTRDEALRMEHVAVESNLAAYAT